MQRHHWSLAFYAFVVDDRVTYVGLTITPAPKAAKRVLEFFTTQINNDHTRKVYLNVARRFADCCEEGGTALKRGPVNWSR
jgi:hypothetical protein